MDRPPLGDLELAVLRHISDHGPLTVGAVASGFGAPRGLARTTVLTVMERLRGKGYIRRRKVGGVYEYSARLPKADVLKGLVRDFRERVLEGTLEPFVAYLAEERDLSDEEIEALRHLLDELESEREGG
jgi:predicted transcriptional regulator